MRCLRNSTARREIGQLIDFVHKYNYFVKLPTRQNIFKLFKRTLMCYNFSFDLVRTRQKQL